MGDFGLSGYRAQKIVQESKKGLPFTEADHEEMRRIQKQIQSGEYKEDEGVSEVKKEFKLAYFDTFVRLCPYFYDAGYLINNGYNCAHPKQEEKGTVDTAYVKGLEVGRCHCCSCPLGTEADEEDVKKYGEEGYEWSESDWILVESEVNEDGDILEEV